MKHAASGRILLWSGGSLWIGLSGAATDFHSHHAVQVSLSIAPSGLRLCAPAGRWQTCRAAVIAAHQTHAFDGGNDLVANIFIEPESSQGQSLHRRARKHGISPIVDGEGEAELAELFRSYSNNADDSILIAAALAVIARLAADASLPQNALDPRIERSIQLIRKQIGAPILLSDIAKSAHLSPDRYRHLFLEQTGIRFRPYILWLRIELALRAYTAKHSLTEAAQAGGFADSAHFTRTFRNMFGIAPSSIKID